MENKNQKLRDFLKSLNDDDFTPITEEQRSHDELLSEDYWKKHLSFYIGDGTGIYYSKEELLNDDLVFFEQSSGYENTLLDTDWCRKNIWADCYDEPKKSVQYLGNQCSDGVLTQAYRCKDAETLTKAMLLSNKILDKAQYCLEN